MDAFGFVILTALCSVILLMYLSIRVGLARKKYNVPLPDQYSDKHNVFNCVQRAYINTCEGYPLFLVLLFAGGDIFPRVGAIAGLVWILGRIVYAHGYYTGIPENRARGTFGYLGLLTLLGCGVANVLNRLDIIDFD